MTNNKKPMTNEELTQELKDLGFEHRMLKMDVESHGHIFLATFLLAVGIAAGYILYSIGYDAAQLSECKNCV